MAIWGISTTTETVANNYGIPKHLKDTDITHTPHNCFADNRGWVYRYYNDNEYSGLSTSYYDEVLVPVSGLNTTGGGPNLTGLGAATPVATFFSDPNKAPIISVGGGATTGITTASTSYVHVVWNEPVYAGAGATVLIRTADANGANPSTPIVATAASVSPSASIPVFTNQGEGYKLIKGFNGQISNRIAFGFTAPSSVLSANVSFLTSTVNAPVSVGSTVIFVANTTGVVAGVSSITVGAVITNKPVVSVATTFITVGTASTVGSGIGIGTAITFTNRVRATKLSIDLGAGVVGTITDFYNAGSATKTFTGNIIRNVGGAGTSIGVGLGTTSLTVSA